MTTLNAFGQRLTKALAAVSVLAFLVSCGNVSTPELAAGAQLDLKGNEVVSYKGQTYPALKQVATGLHAYTTTLSVSQGSVAKFHVSDQSGSALRTRNATADVFRLGLTEEWISSATVATKKQAIPANAWKACCNWPVSMQLNVGAKHIFNYGALNIDKVVVAINSR